MSEKEATARIKINKLLEAAGWRFFRGRQRARQHPPRTQRHDQVSRSRRARRELREDEQGLHRLPAARRQGLPAHRPGGQGRGQEPARRQGAGPQVRPLPELPLRHPLQRQPALLLGSGARQPLRHHLVPDAGLGDRLPEGHAQPAAPDRGAGRRRLHRPDPAPELPIRSRRGRTRPSAPATSRPTSCAFCGPIS